MPNTLTWSYVWPRFLILVAALALVVLSAGGMLYWKLQQTGAQVRLAAAVTGTLETADEVVAAAARQTRAARTPAKAAPLDASRQALGETATELRALSRTLSQAAFRAGGPAVEAAQGTEPASFADRIVNAKAVMPAAVLSIWLGAEDGKPLADEISAFADAAMALSADTGADAPAVRKAWQQLARQNNARINPSLTAMRDGMNAALVSANETNRNVVALVAGAFLATATLLFLVLPVAMMRRAGRGQAEAPATAGSTVPLSAHRRSDRVKLGFLANLDSEIRTSVSGVTAMAELLARTELDDQQRGCVDVIAKSGQALFDLTGGALDYARADCDLLQLDPVPFALRETVEAVADAMAPAAAAKRIELAMRVMRDLPDGYIGDAPRVRQVLSALVGLEIETSGSGTIVIDVSGVLGANATASLAMRVRADGAQMDRDALKHILDPLAEDNAEDSPLSPATRLHLGLAGRLVRLMNGKLTAEALGDGGITLTATLGVPMDQARRDSKEMTASLGTGRRLLVIDDNKVTRDALTEMARTIGFEAAGAENGRLGGLFANHMAGMEKPLDLILIDSELRDESGLRIAADLQADEQVRGTALVLMTAPGLDVSDSDLRHSGIAAAMAKPVGPVRLAQTVRAALETPSVRNVGREEADAGEEPRADTAGDDVPLRELAGVVGMEAANTDAPSHDDEDQRLQVLVAEDNEVNQLVFSQILEGLDLRFRIAVNGRDAVEDFKTYRPHMILMDVSMPEMNGLEATRAIREMEKETGVRTPIVGVTAHSLRGDQEKCMEAGMDDYMSKPISPDMIGAKIAKWMERRRPENDRRRA